ncbi:HAD family hydrolase [Maribellus sediminis]|uniref:HAD family hydrolase n=1 Tax=Maribellus sediminis TaxID=2696285 RepID=UPI0014317583|nr:HAD family phosphatase [Maribellus sediminis]
MPDLSNIKNIIFDLGNVLLNLDFDASIKAFQKLGLNKAAINPSVAFSDSVFYNLETGRITPAEFRSRVRELLNNPNATDQQIDDAWYAMILDIPEKRVKALQDLRSKYRIYLFSNTNEIHIGRLLEEFKAIYGFDFQDLFDEVFYSHEIKARKPEIEAFEQVIKLSGVEPEVTLFVDDLENNILAAENAGLKTFWLKAGMEMADLF